MFQGETTIDEMDKICLRIFGHKETRFSSINVLHGASERCLNQNSFHMGFFDGLWFCDTVQTFLSM